MYAHMLPRKDADAALQQPGRAGLGGPDDARRCGRSSRAGARRELEHAPDTLEDDRPRVRAVFDAIAERLADGRPYLCGDRFTAADLTFAALAAAVVVPPEYGVRLPQPDELPEPVARDVRGLPRAPGGRLRAADVPRAAAGGGGLIPIVAAMPDVLRPLFDQVVIKELEPDRMRKSGLVVPQGSHDLPPNEGIVLAVGDGPPDLPDFKMPVKPGDHVVFPRAPASGSRSRTSGCSCAASARSSA